MRHNKKLYLIKEIINQRLVKGWVKENRIIDEALMLNKHTLDFLQDVKDRKA